MADGGRLVKDIPFEVPLGRRNSSQTAAKATLGHAHAVALDPELAALLGGLDERER